MQPQDGPTKASANLAKLNLVGMTVNIARRQDFMMETHYHPIYFVVDTALTIVTSAVDFPVYASQ